MEFFLIFKILRLMVQPVYEELTWCLEAERKNNLKDAAAANCSELEFVKSLKPGLLRDCIYKPLSFQRAIQPFQVSQRLIPRDTCQNNEWEVCHAHTHIREEGVYLSHMVFIFYLHILRWMIDFTFKGRWAGDCGVSNVKFLQSRFLFGKHIIS